MHLADAPRVLPHAVGPASGSIFALGGWQVLEFVNQQRRKHSLSVGQTAALLCKVAVPIGVVLLLVASYLHSTGYFGPLTARVRGLFVKHTRTGNPLVDSVAEHQPGSTQAYQSYMHHVYHIVPIGFVISCLRWTDSNRSAARPPATQSVII